MIENDKVEDLYKDFPEYRANKDSKRLYNSKD